MSRDIGGPSYEEMGVKKENITSLEEKDLASGDTDSHEVVLAKQEEAPDLFQASIDGLNQWLVEHLERDEQLPRVFFGDVSVSVQAGKDHYSKPRSNDATRFTHVELGFPSEQPPDYIMPYLDGSEDDDPTDSVYGYVPIELVVRWASEKGGAKALPAPENDV